MTVKLRVRREHSSGQFAKRGGQNRSPPIVSRRIGYITKPIGLQMLDPRDTRPVCRPNGARRT